MKALLILAVLLSGCSIFVEPYSAEPPPTLINRTVTLTIKIDANLARFGIKGHTASSCTDTGICVLYLPKLKSPVDSLGWCNYGVMLGRAIFGKRDVEGMECVIY